MCSLCLPLFIVAVPGGWGSLFVPRLFRKGQRPGCSSAQTLQYPAHSQWYIQPLSGRKDQAGCLFCVCSHYINTITQYFQHFAYHWLPLFMMIGFICDLYTEKHSQRKRNKLEFLYQWEVKAVSIPRQYFCDYKILLNWSSSWIIKTKLVVAFKYCVILNKRGRNKYMTGRECLSLNVFETRSWCLVYK